MAGSRLLSLRDLQSELVTERRKRAAAGEYPSERLSQLLEAVVRAVAHHRQGWGLEGTGADFKAPLSHWWTEYPDLFRFISE